jgi:hypothetical protein
VSQKENILLNTENKRIIGVLTGFGVSEYEGMSAGSFVQFAEKSGGFETCV